MKCLVLAGGYDQIALINELKNRGMKVILTDYFENPPAKKFADKHYQVSTLDIDLIKDIAVKENVQLITTACTDQALLTVAKISEEIGLPCYISYEIAKNVTNKLYMKEKFIKGNIPTSKYLIVDTLNIEEIYKLKFPLVVKPVDCNSSKGVKKVECRKELENALVEAIEYSRSKTAIIEEFKEGKEISVDIFVEDGVAKILSISESKKVDINKSNAFTIVQSRSIIDITDKDIEKIKDISQRISKEFKIYNSPMLIQMIINDTEINVLEFSARMGGGTKYKFIETVSGVNIMSKYVDLILGKEVKVIPQNNTKLAFMNYCYSKNGIFERLEGFNELKENRIIDDYFQYKTKGMKIERAQISSDRVAGYLITGNDITEIDRKQHLCEINLKIIDKKGQDIIIKGIY